MNDKLLQQLSGFTVPQLTMAYITLTGSGPEGGYYRIVNGKVVYANAHRLKGMKGYKLSLGAHVDAVTYKVAKKIAVHHPDGLFTPELVAYIDEVLKRKTGVKKK